MARIVSVSADQSAISVDNTAPAANGSDVVNVYVTVKQERSDEVEPVPIGGLAASNVVIAVTPSTGVTITQPTGVTGQDGAVQGSFVSTNAATVSVTATALGRAVTGGATVVVGGGAPSGSGLFYEQPTTVGNTRAASNGFTWSSTGARVSEQVVPAGKSGYGLRIRYGPDAVGADSSAEQPFNMGQDLAAVWIEYDLYVPANFAHRNDSPSNNKFLMIWNTVYGSLSGTWQAGYEYTRTGANSSAIRIMSSLESGSNSLYVTDRPSFADNGKAFIGSGNPLTLGAWHQIRLQFQRSSASGVADGVMKMWINGTLFANTTGLFRNDANTGTTVLRNGYFMGWSNSGFTDTTDFYLYNAKFYNTDPGW